jgi:hypothetical protein
MITGGVSWSRLIVGCEFLCARTRSNKETTAHFRQSIRNQAARHKPNSAVYERYYHNVRMNAVPQDAFMDRGTTSPYLAVLNHLGLICDENAPTTVPDEIMQAVGPDTATRALEEEMFSLRARLEAVHGRASRDIGGPGR